MDYVTTVAGEGPRLVQEGVKWPKSLARLNGAVLIDRLIDVSLKNSVTSISIVVNEEMTEVQDYLKTLRLPISFYLLVESIPSSMYSFYELSRHLDGDKTCLTTIDTILEEEEFSGYIQQFIQRDKLDGLIAATDFIDDEKPLYIETDNELYIRNFLDQADGDCRYISGGICCLRRPALGVLNNAISQGMSRMCNYWRQFIAEGLRLKAYPFSKTINVDRADDILKAESFSKPQRILSNNE